MTAPKFRWATTSWHCLCEPHPARRAFPVWSENFDMNRFKNPLAAAAGFNVKSSFVPAALIVTSFLCVSAASDVHAVFNLVDPAIGPFPSDQFTVQENSQITGRRVAMPKPDCLKQASDCDDISIINTLDGFSLQPRITFSFDGAINSYSVSSKSVLLVEYGAAAPARLIGINQVVWDPATSSLHLNSDESLTQHAQFALIATNGILDAQGKPVLASGDFTQFIASGAGDYRDRLRAGIDAAVSLGIVRENIVAASVFTTMSATAILEKIRDQIHAGVPQPASFVTNGVRTVFPRSAITSVTVHRQTRVSPPVFSDAVYLLAGLDLVPGSVSTVAYGTFSAPNYETPQQVIPQVATLTGNPIVQGTNTLSFNLILPSGTQPAKGWPVARSWATTIADPRRIFTSSPQFLQNMALPQSHLISSDTVMAPLELLTLS